MNRTKIDWADYSFNPVTGHCNGGCWYCYANRMCDRFKWNPRIEFHPERLGKIEKIKEPSKIFIGSTHDIFGDWIPQNWIDSILFNCSNPQHTFFFLTKNPLRYIGLQLANNQWAGVTHTGKPTKVGYSTDGVLDAQIIIGFEYQPHCFLSCEPLLGDAVDIPSKCEWLIIGAMTGHGKRYQPKLEWIANLVEQARKMNIPIYMKRNLQDAWWPNQLIQEFPKGVPT